MKTQSLWKQQQFSTGTPKRCYICKTPLSFETATVDHIRPKAHGGKNQSKNFKLACLRCNARKGETVLTAQELARVWGREAKRPRDYSKLIAAIKAQREKERSIP